MLERVRHEVVHDPLELRRVDLGDDRVGAERDAVAFELLHRGDRPLHESRDVRRLERHVHEAVPEAVDVQQI